MPYACGVGHIYGISVRKNRLNYGVFSKKQIEKMDFFCANLQNLHVNIFFSTKILRKKL